MPDSMSLAETQAKMGLMFVCSEMCKDPYEAFKLQILSHLLFEGPNSLFYKEIIEEDLAPNFCPGYGYDHTTRQSTFLIGVQGIEQKQFHKIEEQIFKSLEKAVEQGFEKS